MKLKRKNIPSSFGRLNRRSALKFSGDPEPGEVKIISEDDKQIVSERITEQVKNLGGGELQNEDQKQWYDAQIKQRMDEGMDRNQAIQAYRNDFNIGEQETVKIVEQKVDTKDQEVVSSDQAEESIPFWHYVDELGEEEFFSGLANNINALDRWKKMQDDKRRGYSSSSNMYARGTNARFIPRRSGYNVAQGMMEMYKNDPEGLKEVLINNYPEMLGMNSTKNIDMESVDLVPGNQGTWKVVSKEVSKK
jgi:hypothetical protein